MLADPSLAAPWPSRQRLFALGAGTRCCPAGCAGGERGPGQFSAPPELRVSPARRGALPPPPPRQQLLLALSSP
eukprot:8434672-Alexandrium_andersonii.AAC.1